MLYVIYGKDREKGRARFRALRDELSLGASEERSVLEGEISEDFLNEAAASQGLFGNKTLFVLDCLFDKKDEQELLSSSGTSLVSSPNIFLVFEPSLDKGVAETLKEAGATNEECVLKSADTRPDFNIFSLGDALGQRNKKELWVLYQGALNDGLSPEEICGTLFWSIKNIALIKDTKPGYDKGMSPFVAKKARGFAQNYTHEEIIKISRELVSIYHESHRGGEPMDIALERFILSL